MSEIENDRLSIRVKEGLKKANKEGCWTRKSPYGYTNYRLPNKKSTLIPDENARYVFDAFLLLSTQNISVKKAWVQMRTKGMIISSSQFYELIRNPVYIGKILFRSDDNQTMESTEGLHVPILPTTLFEKVQEKLSFKPKINVTKKGAKNHLYPLRGYIKCSRCGKILTASASTGSNPNKKYHYYHCRGGCKERFSVKKAHELFYQYLKKISIDRKQFDIAKKRIKNKIQKQEESLKMNKQKTRKQIAKIQDIISRAEDRFFEGLIDSETFKNSKIRYLRKIEVLENEIVQLNNFNRVFEFQTRVEKLKQFIDLSENFKNGDFCKKRRLLESILNDKVILPQ